MKQLRTLGKTRIATRQPWGLMFAAGTRLLCGDGKIRAPHRLAATPDTFFSTPAAVRVKGKYITGYMTVEEACSGDYKSEARAYVFRPHTESNAKAGNPLPEFPEKFAPGSFEWLSQFGEVVTG